ncbi:MAG: tetratricopeptide repeat protein [Salaquimonas sp.]
MSHNISVSDSKNVSISVNDPIDTVEKYEAHVQRRIDKTEAELREAHAKEIAAKDEVNQTLRDTIDSLRDQIDLLNEKLSNPIQSFQNFQAMLADTRQRLEHLNKTNAQIGISRLSEAGAAAEAGDFVKADEIFAEVEESEAGSIERAAEAAFGRGTIAENDFRWSDAADHFARAARLEPSYDNLMRAGNSLRFANRNPEAIRHHEDLVEMAQTEYGSSDFKTAVALNNLARTLSDNRDSRAGALFGQALAIFESHGGFNNDDAATCANNYGDFLRKIGRPQEAITWYEIALQQSYSAQPPNLLHQAMRENNLAGALETLGQLDKAEAGYNKAIRIGRELGLDHHPDMAVWIGNLGGVYMKLRRWSKAEKCARQAHHIRLKTLGEQHSSTAFAAANLGILLARVQKKDEAIHYLEAAIRFAHMTKAFDASLVAEWERNLRCIR